MSYFKCTAALRRREDLDLEGFSRHWSTIHRELALRLVAPGYMRGYVQNHRLPEPLGTLRAAGDGCPELWIESPEEFAKLATSPEYLEGARLDEPNFMAGEPLGMIGRETILIPSASRAEAASLAKAMIFLSRAPERKLANEARHLLEDLCATLCRVSTPIRLSHERATEVPAALGEPAYDWILSVWWQTPADLERAWQAAERQTTGAKTILQGMRIKELPVVLPEGAWTN